MRHIIGNMLFKKLFRHKEDPVDRGEADAAMSVARKLKNLCQSAIDGCKPASFIFEVKSDCSCPYTIRVTAEEVFSVGRTNADNIVAFRRDQQ